MNYNSQSLVINPNFDTRNAYFIRPRLYNDVSKKYIFWTGGDLTLIKLLSIPTLNEVR